MKSKNRTQRTCNRVCKRTSLYSGVFLGQPNGVAYQSFVLCSVRPFQWRVDHFVSRMGLVVTNKFNVSSCHTRERDNEGNFFLILVTKAHKTASLPANPTTTRVDTKTYPVAICNADCSLYKPFPSTQAFPGWWIVRLQQHFYRLELQHWDFRWRFQAPARQPRNTTGMDVGRLHWNHVLRLQHSIGMHSRLWMCHLSTMHVDFPRTRRCRRRWCGIGHSITIKCQCPSMTQADFEIHLVLRYMIEMDVWHDRDGCFHTTHFLNPCPWFYSIVFAVGGMQMYGCFAPPITTHHIVFLSCARTLAVLRTISWME